MPISWSNDIESLDWQALELLYRKVPLGNKSAAHLQTVFTNSRLGCFACDGTQLMAAGRAMADGADCSYIADLAVMSEHQGSGLDKEVVSRRVEASSDHKKIILCMAPGKEGSYKKRCFPEMLTALALFKDGQAGLARGHLGEA